MRNFIELIMCGGLYVAAGFVWLCAKFVLFAGCALNAVYDLCEKIYKVYIPEVIEKLKPVVASIKEEFLNLVLIREELLYECGRGAAYDETGDIDDLGRVVLWAESNNWV